MYVFRILFEVSCLLLLTYFSFWHLDSSWSIFIRHCRRKRGVKSRRHFFDEWEFSLIVFSGLFILTWCSYIKGSSRRRKIRSDVSEWFVRQVKIT